MRKAKGVRRSGEVMRASGRITASAEQPWHGFEAGQRRLMKYLVFALIGLSIFWYLDSKGVIESINRPIAKVRLEDQWRHIEQEDIRAVLNGHLGRGYFSFDVTELKHELQSHPWVAHATVKKLWPDTLSISLSEQVAIARWGDTQLLNQQGETISPGASGAFAHLPLLRGPVGSQSEVMVQYQHFSGMLFSSGLELQELALSARGSWEIELENGLQITLGKVAVSDRLSRFIRFYQGVELEQRAKMEAADLRYDNGIAVRFNDQTVSELSSG